MPTPHIPAFPLLRRLPIPPTPRIMPPSSSRDDAATTTPKDADPVNPPRKNDKLASGIDSSTKAILAQMKEREAEKKLEKTAATASEKMEKGAGKGKNGGKKGKETVTKVLKTKGKNKGQQKRRKIAKDDRPSTADESRAEKAEVG